MGAGVHAYSSPVPLGDNQTLKEESFEVQKPQPWSTHEAFNEANFSFVMISPNTGMVCSQKLQTDVE